MKSLISIIVPIYNVECYIRQCIDSIIAQDYHNLEIILVDDGSTDTSPQICDQYKAIDKRISVIHKANGGLVSARKVGIQRSSGQFIMYVDGDDWIEPLMIGNMLKRQIEVDADVVVCNFFQDDGKKLKVDKPFFEEGSYDKYRMENEMYPQMICETPFYKFGLMPSLCGKLFRKELIFGIQLEVDDCITLGEDAVCTYRFMLESNSCFIMHEAYYHYRFNFNSMTRSYNPNQLAGTSNLICTLRKTIANSEKYRLRYQVDQYHCMITMRNIYNLGLAKFDRGYFDRVKEFGDYLEQTKFIEVINRCYSEIRQLNIERRSSFFLIRHGLWRIVLFVYCVKNILK